MPETIIYRAETQADFDAARLLCQAWVDWQLKTFPDLRDTILTAFEPAAYAKTMADLAHIHARPEGAILLARLNRRAVGCVMYHKMENGVAEVKRLFVDESGRGHGLGKALLLEMFTHMRHDGYAIARFSSARFLIHARALYDSVGFHDIAQPPDFPDTLRKVVYFMERAL